MEEIPCDFVYGLDCILRWRGLEQNKEVMLPRSIKGWTRSRVALVDPGVPDKDRWLVISTDLRSKAAGSGHEAALRFTEDEWGKKATATWFGETHATCIFTNVYGEVKMMYSRFRKTRRGAYKEKVDRMVVDQLSVKRYAAAIRVVGDHLQFWIPLPPEVPVYRKQKEVRDTFGVMPDVPHL